MRRLICLGVIAGLMACLSGCIQSKTVMTVHKDGSGTIEQTAYIVKMNAGTPERTEAELNEHYAEIAKKMGDGVSVKSLKALTDHIGATGVHVVYAFTDVSKVAASAMPAMGDISVKGEEMHFQFDKGAQNTLTVSMPPVKSMNAADDEKAAKPSADEEKMQDAMIAQVFKDMLIDFELRVDGNVSKTNAASPNTTKDGVVLMHEDFGALIKDPAAMKVFKSLTTVKDVKVMKDLLRDPAITKYVQIDPSEKVVVEFK